MGGSSSRTPGVSGTDPGRGRCTRC
jgi:hypothetical protein